MASNHKLTGVIRGRTVKTAEQQGAVLSIGFDDGSTMTVQTLSGSGQGTYTLTITGTSGSLTHTATASLQVRKR